VKKPEAENPMLLSLEAEKRLENVCTVDCTGAPWTLTKRLTRPFGHLPRGFPISINDVLVIFSLIKIEKSPRD
jgi:hypothetical protein